MLRVCYYGPHDNQEYEFESEKSEIIIGRVRGLQTVDLDLTAVDKDRTVSRPHARVGIENEQHWIENLSQHGTFVNETRVEGRVRLSSDDEIKMGEVRLRLQPSSKKLPPPAKVLLSVHLEVMPEINYALVEAGIPAITSVEIVNQSQRDLANLKLDLRLGKYARLSQPISLTALAPLERFRVEGAALPKLEVDSEKLRDIMTSRTVKFEAIASGYEVEVQPAAIKILPTFAWYTRKHQEALAGFVMPFNRAIVDIVHHSRAELGKLAGRADFDTLDLADPHLFEMAVKALYNALCYQYQIAYGYEPINYEDHWQPLRLHHEVLAELKGTCIDLALLFAACLERIRIPPLIVVIRSGQGGHALIGCWRGNPIEMAHAETVISEAQQIEKYIAAGQLLILDSIGFAKGADPDGEPIECDFNSCKRRGRALLQQACKGLDSQRFRYAVNIAGARRAGVMPLPPDAGLDRLASQAMAYAREIAEETKSSALMIRHLYAGLLANKEGWLQRVLAELKIDVAKVEARLHEIVQDAAVPDPPSDLKADKNWEAVFQQEVIKRSTYLISEADLTEALLQTPSRAHTVLKAGGTTPTQCLEMLNQLRGKGQIPSGPICSDSLS